MATYVVDTTIMIAYLHRHELRPAARTLIEVMPLTDNVCIPDFCLVETTNTLWKLVRFANVPEDDALALVESLEYLTLRLVASNTLMPEALRIGLKHLGSVYDAVYIALAKSLNATFITLDKKQAAVAVAEGVIVQPLADFLPSSGEGAP